MSICALRRVIHNHHKPRYYYGLFGLCLQTHCAIPGLLPGPVNASADIKVWLGPQPPRWVQEHLPHRRKIWYQSENRDEGKSAHLTIWLWDTAYFEFCYSDDIRFVLDKKGHCIWGTWSGKQTFEDAVTYLIGPIIGFVLRLRGIVALHASAVVFDEYAVGFLGRSGAGKSTTAAAFANRGYPILADDVSALQGSENNNFVVQPAYPRLRLWSTAAVALFGSAEALPLLTTTWTKRYLDLTGSVHHFQHKPLPLTAIYLLNGRSADAKAPFVEALSLQDSLISLVANTYANHFLDTAMRAQELQRLSRIVQSIPVRRVTPHTDSARLSMLCDIILSDFQQLHSARASAASG